jgi:psp operon transcriptional activator
MPYKTNEALGQSEAFLEIQERLSRVAPVDRPVLITGERGTGKELAASRIHYLSKRWQHPFVALNCAALTPSLLESELFGHEPGAFTGAVQLKKGRFEMAHEGTLFLDEIGNMPMVVQEKILRVIEYGTFERVGGTKPVSVDVRIVSATNTDLPALARSGKFKDDLLDRLSFEVISLPPLRARKEDILLLANHFAAQIAVELNLPGIPEFSPEVIDELYIYTWPGNIRELKNVVERAVYQNEGGTINYITLNPFRKPFPPSPQPAQMTTSEHRLPSETGPEMKDLNLKQAVKKLEGSYMNEAMKQTRFNQKKAAKLLGLTYHQFRGIYRKYEKNT